jgi:sugar phosphate isomerase/epimerase
MKCSSITLEDYPVEEALRLLRAGGFTGVEMWHHHLRRCTTPELREKFASYAKTMGLTVAGLNVAGEDYFQPFGTDAQAEKTILGLRSDMQFALSLGTPNVLIWEGKAPPNTTESDWLNRLLPRLIEILRAAIEVARPYGVRFLVEPHPFTVGMSDLFLIRLCDALDPAHFGITYDFCHYGVGRKNDYIEAIRKLGHRIRNVHFSDSDQKTSELHFPPGTGRMQIRAALQAFRDIHYDGTMAIDLYAYPMPVRALPLCAVRLKEACEFLGLQY